MHNLFSGPAVVIDDQIAEGNTDDINRLIKEIEDKHMPCSKHTSLPSEEIINHLTDISFLLLDWKLQDLPAGTSIPDSLIKPSIDFLKKVVKQAFIPIFIFTSEDTDTVKSTLENNGLYDPNGPNLIFVENKSELVANNLFTKIEEWIKKTPSVYVLKEWEKEYQKSKTGLFIDFYNLNHSWPKILWATYEQDNVDPSHGIGEIITKNLHTRMSPFELDDRLLNSTDSIEQSQIRSVLAGERFIENKNNRIKENSISSGDVFKFKLPEQTKFSYYINIRPDCDCINRNQSCSTDDLELYLLRLSKLKPKDEKELFHKKFGTFEEHDTNTIIFNMCEDRSFRVNHKELSIKTWGYLKEHRIGRLLPPYITRVQQRYSLFLQRQGLPRPPTEAVRGVTDESET